jgi:hypothetical protein
VWSGSGVLKSFHANAVEFAFMHSRKLVMAWQGIRPDCPDSHRRLALDLNAAESITPESPFFAVDVHFQFLNWWPQLACYRLYQPGNITTR